MCTDRTVLVTGASSGIGLATVRAFAARGCRVFGTSRREHPGEPGITMIRLDLRSDESVRNAIGEVLHHADSIDVLVNNAGVMHQGFAEETGPAEAKAVFGTNFFGPVRVINAVLPGMRSGGGGRIINVGSLAAWLGEPGEAFYAASKAALARYTQALRHEVRHRGISVSVVEPGAFRTNVMDAASQARATIADYDGLRENARGALRRSLRAGGNPDKVAALIVKVAELRSPRLRYGVGPEALMIPRIIGLLPSRVVEYLIRREFGLPR